MQKRFWATLESDLLYWKPLLQKSLSDLEFYGDLVYKFRKILGETHFSMQFKKIVTRFKKKKKKKKKKKG